MGQWPCGSLVAGVVDDHFVSICNSEPCPTHGECSSIRLDFQEPATEPSWCPTDCCRSNEFNPVAPGGLLDALHGRERCQARRTQLAVRLQGSSVSYEPAEKSIHRTYCAAVV